MTLFHQHTGQLRTWARRTLWCIIVVGSLCAVVIPIFLIYRREGDNSRSVVDVGPQGVSHTGDYIHVVGSVASVDFEDKNFRVHFEFTPHGSLSGDDGVLTSAIAVSLFYTTLTFPETQIMRSVDVTMPYMQGATIDYPFDAYKSYFEILANKDKEQLHRIPVSLTFLGMLQTVEFVPIVHLDPLDTYKISIEIFTRRSPTTIGFSLFIVLIMWALSIAIGIITIQVIRKHRVSDEHILTLGITTLFALPALRETQPGIPAIGCAADVLGFYWNMAIIAISSIMILMASALRWKEPSIEKEIELVHKQHDFQSKLISEMTVPMPFPITGGPFYDYQVRKKRIPFVMPQHHIPRNSNSSRGSSLQSPLYSEGGHEYHPSSRDGYYFTYHTPSDEHPPELGGGVGANQGAAAGPEQGGQNTSTTSASYSTAPPRSTASSPSIYTSPPGTGSPKPSDSYSSFASTVNQQAHPRSQQQDSLLGQQHDRTIARLGIHNPPNSNTVALQEQQRHLLGRHSSTFPSTWNNSSPSPFQSLLPLHSPRPSASHPSEREPRPQGPPSVAPSSFFSVAGQAGSTIPSRAGSTIPSRAGSGYAGSDLFPSRSPLPLSESLAPLPRQSQQQQRSSLPPSQQQQQQQQQRRPHQHSLPAYSAVQQSLSSSSTPSPPNFSLNAHTASTFQHPLERR